MIKKRNKRAQEMSTNAIVLIILAVVILVILVLGFTMGWSKIAPWVSSSNVDTIVNQCSVACNTNSAYEFCAKKFELKDEDLDEGSVAETCYVFSKDARYLKYGIEECNLIDCSDYKKDCAELIFIDKDGKEFNGVKSASCDAYEEDLTIYALDLDTGERCCANELD